METKTLVRHFINELKKEDTASRKCLERIPDTLYKYKPHEKSMEFGYLALLVAEIPLWITSTIRDSVIDFATYKHFQLSTTDALVEHYDENLKTAIATLEQATDEQLSGDFSLKNNGQLLYSAPKIDSIAEDINHWVHHRGQLTVYMRLNDIMVPSIYGPSADDRKF
ncbi:MAG: damage-inducible protein DinB [Citrobacter freundii]|nr:MAG: damage-inducible protein DinB [Citrobacter freundii]